MEKCKLKLSSKNRILYSDNTPFKLNIKISPKSINLIELHYNNYVGVDYILISSDTNLDILKEFGCYDIKLSMPLKRCVINTKIFNKRNKEITLALNDINKYLTKYKLLECKLEHERVCKNGMCIFNITQIKILE